MAKSYEQLQQSLTFDELMRFLDGQFKPFPDYRVGNAVRYELADVLKSANAQVFAQEPLVARFQKPDRPGRE